MVIKPSPLKVFVDSDVLFAGAASPGTHSASLVLLQMAEITLIETMANTQVIYEVEKNLKIKLPEALPVFRELVDRCLRIVEDPHPEEINVHSGKAHQKDLPILVSAKREGCPILVTFNIKDYQPGVEGVAVMVPGAFVSHVRDILTGWNRLAA